MSGMSDPSEQTFPAKCSQCNKPISTPLVCDYCSAPQELTGAEDYYEMLSMPRSFDMDLKELRRKFLSLNRHAHPDYHTADSPEVRSLSLRVSATINNAYRTLLDPAARAGYLLELLGGKSSANDKSVPDGFLETMMMMQEELHQAIEKSDERELARLGDVLKNQHDGLLAKIAETFATFQQDLPCKAMREESLDELRKQVNAVAYVRKLQTMNNEQ
ncbi:MAG TPA: Fe-S protein assembly co-chaperone HscB [Phycisphaerae bacterium]|nr:Fe-S protein assembly co-chaperone HscB [Phycisphaerae bacterium]